MGRFGRKRLAVDLPIEIHLQIKEMADKYNIKITEYVLRMILEKLEWEKSLE